MDLGVIGRKVLITGGSAGIGLETARLLAADGARVAIAARDRARLDAALGELVAVAGPDAPPVAIACDLGEAGEPERAVAEAVEMLGGLDVLVNNVGVARQVALDALGDDDWERSFHVNLMSHVRATRAALPHLRRSDQARIVNVSSTAGKRPSTGMPDYTVMKAALLSFSRLVADVEARNGVLVNAVCPGPALTPTWLAPGGLADQAAAKSGGSREDALAAVGKGRPLGRLAEPEEIASVVAFLCSARAGYVTGAAWGVDGGTVPVII